jgi:glycosyltransferase involved in cell wall biosynthesis
MIKYSIITISLNAAGDLKRTVESVNEQTHPGVEHVIIDGGSLDRSAEIVKAIAHRDVRWVSEPDGGIADAFNKGTALGTGDFFCYLNAGDTFVSAETLSKVAESMAIGGSVQTAVYFGDYVSVVHGIERTHSTTAAPEAFAWFNPLNHQSAFVPRDLAKQNPYDARLALGMDYDFWLRIAPVAEFRKLPFPVARFALDGRSSSPAWAVHNLVVRRVLWHTNRGTRIEFGDLIILCAKAVRLKGRLALRELLGPRFARSFRRFKASRGAPMPHSPPEALAKPLE